VNTLHSATEGWAAALRIAASSLTQSNQDFTQYVRALSGASRPIGDYIEGMLTSLPGDVVYYMLRTSILDRLTAPLCRAVTGMDASQELLESIAGRQLLLEPLDAEGAGIATTSSGGVSLAKVARTIWRRTSRAASARLPVVRVSRVVDECRQACD